MGRLCLNDNYIGPVLVTVVPGFKHRICYTMCWLAMKTGDLWIGGWHNPMIGTIWINVFVEKEVWV